MEVIVERARVIAAVQQHIRDRDGRWDAYDDAAAVLRDAPGARGVIRSRKELVMGPLRAWVGPSPVPSGPLAACS